MPIVYSKKKINKIINLLFQRVAHWPDNYNTKKKKITRSQFYTV